MSKCVVLAIVEEIILAERKSKKRNTCGIIKEQRGKNLISLVMKKCELIFMKILVLIMI